MRKTTNMEEGRASSAKFSLHSMAENFAPYVGLMHVDVDG